MSSPTPAVVQLRAAGTSVVVELAEPVPRVLHWGTDLGDLDDRALAALSRTGVAGVLNNSLDVTRQFSVWPTEAEGWSGTPAHEGHRAGTATTPRPRLTGARRGDDGRSLTLELADDVSGLDVRLVYTLHPSGVLAVDAELTARAEGAYQLAGVTALLPLPRRAGELLDFTGKWCRERAPQRAALHHGTHLREVRRGKPGVDSPYLLAAGVPGFSFRSGEVWAVHVGWSGNQRYLAQELPEGAGSHAAALGGGELLRPGEISLGPGAVYRAPTCWFAWSDAGLDGLADRFHDLLRARPHHPSSPRPLLLNTWEAVYFDHDLDRLVRLADLAAGIGVERVVLDDGWFSGRRDDTAGLGDWTVDAEVWPDGLAPFADHVHALGMQFGLWFEPEMVNPDSELARAHPNWLLGPSVGLGPTARHQHAVNLTDPDAFAYLLDHLDAVVTKYAVDFLKWDHNRDLHEAVARGPHGDRPAVHEQTLTLYRLLDELRRRHPGLEIESCASGGGRVDLGVLEHTDRVWASDCNDPVERQAIQRWTGQLLPPELIGTHVGPTVAHTTHRHTAWSFRLATALFGHAGLELDLTRCTEDELATLTAWGALYRRVRPLLHTGRVVRGDLGGDDTLLHGVVARDRSAALYCWARLATTADGQPGRVPLPGLAPDRTYRVEVRREIGTPSWHQTSPPPWVVDALAGGIEVPGVVLVGAGLPMPTLDPEQAMVLELTAVDVVEDGR